MKKKFLLLIVMVSVISFFSCKNNKDNFLGKWVECEDPVWSLEITMKDGFYNVKSADDKGSRDETLEKKGENLLSEVNGKTTLLFDKSTNRLTISYGAAGYSWEFCKVNN